MAGFERFVAVLRLFDDDRSDWTVPGIAAALNVPASTIYRAVRDLVDHGFLEPSAEAHYRLGAAFVEFDRRVRLTDPLIRIGAATLADLVASARAPCVAVLARLYHDMVICVASLQASEPPIPTSYERGRPMPLLRGATSKAILARLPPRALKKLIEAAPGAPDHAGAEPLRRDLALIRKQGFCVTRGEVDAGLVGIAVPVARPDLAITASMSLILRQADVDEALERRLVMLLVASGALLADGMALR
jgi:DNA-binding IclR family transcriptional regulator